MEVLKCCEYEWKEHSPFQYEKVNVDELNIIGFYRLARTQKVEPKIAPWANFKNDVEYKVECKAECKVECKAECKTDKNEEEKMNRDKGFFILSNRKNVVTYLKKTKFCKLLIEQGRCNREVCNFAHTVKEIVFPFCAFGNECSKKQDCAFRHPNESIEGYKNRIQFTIPPNIL